MWTLRRARHLPAFSLLIVGTVSLAAPGLARTAATAARPHPAGVRPNKVGELDCNGLSPIQRPVKPNLVCADPRGPYGGRFYDNGHYIGHDEPEVRFLSSRPGSGNNVTITETLPRDPAALPAVKTPGHDVTHWFELTNAPWLSIDVCDPNSSPLLPCQPRSDSNAPHGRYPGGGAGLALPGGAGQPGGAGGIFGSTTLSSSQQQLYRYVSAHRDGAGYLLAVSSWSEASAYILATGQEVMPMGGFSGSVPEPTLTRVKQLVATGQLRFFLLGGTGGFGGPGRGGADGTAAQVASWVESACAVVPAADYGTSGSSAQTLYACGSRG